MGLSGLAAGIFGDDEDEAESGTDDGGDFAGEGGVDGGALDGDLEGDDDFGDLDGWDDDEELGGDDGGAASELEPRLDELENEVASISSSMGTVRSENEAIQESVEDIEDNIRKLLEIYEMVTRGVNPFVDEPQGGGMGGSFGLFDDAGDDDDFDDLDPDVADADPDSFFDDDFDDGGFEDDFEDDDFEEGAVEEDPFGDDALDDGDPVEGDFDATGADGDDGGGEGKTFDELKSEYQAGDAAWEDADDLAGAHEESSTDSDAGRDLEENPAAGVDDVEDGSSADTGELVEEAIEDLTPSDGSEDRSDGGEEPSPSGDDSRDGKPYLEKLPSGYGVELLVIEWLSYLRNQSSTSEALRAIKYYETIGWIGSPAADSLQRYLSGLTGDDVAPSSGGGTQLTIDHHTNSLHYIGKLGGTDVNVERLEWTGPSRSGSRMERRGQRGIQR
jgi:archaellum component FlaD/FlaE/archaellum component FlaC